VRGQELILTFHGLEGPGAEPPRGASEAERKVWVPREWLEAILDALPRAGVRVAFWMAMRSPQWSSLSS